jgi:membrane protease subunit HflK
MSWQQQEEWQFPEELKKWGQNPKQTAKLVLIGAAIVVLGWLALSSYYTVKADERALVLRFGAVQGTSGPGLHLKLPFGIDTVKKVAVKEVKREEFGFRTEKPGVQTVYREDTPELLDEARMLTGDLNILNLQWAVRYRVEDIKDYFINVRDPRATIRDVSEAVMRTVVGDSSVDEVLTIDRERVQIDCEDQMQTLLDDYGTGIHLVNVRLKDVSPPEAVKDAFNDVNKARQRKETIINEAEAERNSKIPEAQGKKERTIEEANGYAEERVNHFLALLKVYEAAPDVTRRRIYLERMREVLSKVDRKYILDSTSPQVLKFLDLQAQAREGGSQ